MRCLLLLITFIGSATGNNGGLCATIPSGTPLVQWYFEGMASPRKLSSPIVPSTVQLVANKVISLESVRVTTCDNVLGVGESASVMPELELSKSSLLIQVVMATTPGVTSGTVLSAGYVPSTMNVLLDHGKLMLKHTNLVTDVRSQATEVRLEPDDFRLVSLYLDATQALLFLDTALVGRLKWDFAGVGGIGGDSSLAVQFGPLTDAVTAEIGGAAPTPQPFLIHTVRFTCLETPPAYTVDDVLALLAPARAVCHRLRSPVERSTDPLTTGVSLVRPGTIANQATGASNATDAAPGARPAVPGWLIGTIVGATLLVVIVGCIAAYIVARKVRRNRIDEVQRAIEMERKSVRRQPSSTTLTTARSTVRSTGPSSAGYSAPPSNLASGASQTYAGPSDAGTVDLTEAINDDKQAFNRHINEQAAW